MNDNNQTISAKIIFDGKQLGLQLDDIVSDTIHQPLPNSANGFYTIDQLRQAIHRSNMVIVHFDSLGGFSG